MRKYLKFVFLCLLAALILVWFGWNLDRAKVSEAIGRSNGWLIALAAGIICVVYLVRALRWRVLLGPLAPGASLRELFAATTVGFAAIFLIGRAGEVARPAFLPLRDRRVRAGAAFVTIAVERLCDISAIILFFAANLLFFRAPAGGDPATYARVRQAGLVLFVAAVAGIAGLFVFRSRTESIAGRLDERLKRAPRIVSRVGGIVTGLLRQLARSLSVFTDARELAAVAGLTALVWGLIAAANWLVFQAFHLPAGVSDVLFVLGWSLVGSLVPTPGGGAGAYHKTTAEGLKFVGVDENVAAAVAIVLHLVLFAPAVPFGLYYFLRSDVSLARLKEIAAAEGDGRKVDEVETDGQGATTARA